MAEAMHRISFEVSEAAYEQAEEKARQRGYLSLEEYVSDLLESQPVLDVNMTPELRSALEDGLADSKADRVITIDVFKRRHAEKSADWIRAREA